MTDLCVAIFVNDLAQARRDVATAAEAGATLVEFRIDRFTDATLVTSLVADSILPCIVTCRPTWEGGHYDGDEDARLELLDAASRAGARYVDIELVALQEGSGVRGQGSGTESPPSSIANRKSKIANPFADSSLNPEPLTLNPSLIVSTHDFQGRPDRLYNLISDMNAGPGTVNKIVWAARSIRDNAEAFEILKSRQKPTVALCMGEAGLPSRVLAKKFGAFLTFVSLEAGAGTAPGQVSIADMKRLYRWDAINPNTKVYGVVGSPVAHSMSPAIHNAAFEAVGHDGVYLPLLVEPSYESFKAFMETFLHCEGLHLSGLSVTIPHKENCLRYLKEKSAEIEPLAERIGTVNTVVIEEGSGVRGQGSGVEKSAALDGAGHTSNPIANRKLQIANSPNPEPRPLNPRLRGFNTDYAAILDSITAKLDITREDLRDYRVAVLGAGGTGRTAVAALADYGATVVVYNRTKEKADALAAEFNGRTGHVVSAHLEKLCDSCCHVYLNCTKVGMYPNVHESPVADSPPKFSDQSLVFDTIYNPIRTRLIEQAEAAGAMTIGGVEMFVRQAQRQFESWTGKPAPTDLMRRVVEQRLTTKPS